MKKFQRIRSIIALTCILGGVSFGLPSFAADTAQGLPALTEPAAVQGVNVNTASAAELAAAISGVGLAKAQAIVEYRKLNGEFLQLEELSQVKGIGAATLEKNKESIRFQ